MLQFLDSVNTPRVISICHPLSPSVDSPMLLIKLSPIDSLLTGLFVSGSGPSLSTGNGPVQFLKWMGSVAPWHGLSEMATGLGISTFTPVSGAVWGWTRCYSLAGGSTSLRDWL